jgi:hypothetical protein
MEIEIELEPQIIENLAKLRRERGWTFDEAVNAVIRAGLDAAEAKELDAS